MAVSKISQKMQKHHLCQKLGKTSQQKRRSDRQRQNTTPFNQFPSISGKMLEIASFLRKQDSKL